MKKWTAVIVLLCLMSGCQENMTAKLGELTSTVRVLNQQVEGYQEASIEIVKSLESAGIVDEKLVAKLDKIHDEIDRVQPQMGAIVDAIDGAEASEDATLAIIKTLQAANSASTPFNPYAAPIAGVLAIVSAILGMVAKNKTDEAKANAAMALEQAKKYEAHKIVVAKTLLTADKEVAKTMYEDIGTERARLGVT